MNLGTKLSYKNPQNRNHRRGNGIYREPSRQGHPVDTVSANRTSHGAQAQSWDRGQGLQGEKVYKRSADRYFSKTTRFCKQLSEKEDEDTV